MTDRKNNKTGSYNYQPTSDNKDLYKKVLKRKK